MGWRSSGAVGRLGGKHGEARRPVTVGGRKAAKEAKAPKGPPGEPRRAVRQRERRRQLLDGAIAALAENGYAATTVAQIAAKAGLSHGLVGFHFAGKAALLDAVVERLASEFQAAWETAREEAGTEAAARIEAMALAPLGDAVCAPDRLAVWYAFWGEAAARASYREVSLALEDAYLDALAAEIARLPHPPAEPALAARLISAGVDNLWQDLHLGSGRLDRAEARRQQRGFLRLVLPHAYPSSGG